MMDNAACQKVDCQEAIMAKRYMVRLTDKERKQLQESFWTSIVEPT